MALNYDNSSYALVYIHSRISRDRWINDQALRLLALGSANLAAGRSCVFESPDSGAHQRLNPIAIYLLDDYLVPSASKSEDANFLTAVSTTGDDLNFEDLRIIVLPLFEPVTIPFFIESGSCNLKVYDKR